MEIELELDEEMKSMLDVVKLEGESYEETIKRLVREMHSRIFGR